MSSGAYPAPRVVLGGSPGSLTSRDIRLIQFIPDGSGGPGTIQVEAELPWIYLVNTDSGTHTMTMTPRAATATAAATMGYPLVSGAMISFPTSIFAQIKDGNPNSTIYAFYSDVPLTGPNSAAGSGGGFVGEVTANNSTAEPQNANAGILGAGSNDIDIISEEAGNHLSIDVAGVFTTTRLAGDNFIVNTNGNATFGGKVTSYNGVALALNGLPTVLGADNRVGRNATDGAAITVYSTTTANPLLRLMARIFGTAGTVTSATYVVRWTEGGNVITKTLNITSVDTDADLSVLIQPDIDTNITAQITVITGAGCTVDVACAVETLKGS